VKLTKKTTEMLSGSLARYDRIVLLSHLNPDGDAIGSLLGFYWFLKGEGKKISMAVPNRMPHFLGFLPGSKKILVYSENPGSVNRSISQAQLIICLDFNEPQRLGDMLNAFKASEAETILIDHHPGPARFTGHIISFTGISSTAEILYRLIGAMKTGTAWLNKNIATCLFAGIMTDTGCFQYSSSLPQTYLAVAQLLKQGIDKDRIYSKVYDNYSAGRMRLMGYALNEKMVVLEDAHAAYISLTRAEMKKYSHVAGDTEGFVNLPFSIRGMKVTALMVEKKDHIKISFRSKGSIDINRFAREHYNGGGHRNAAGGESYLPLDETISSFEQLIRKFLKKVDD
jgi:phosphoesterase RecJ-like protein